MDEAVAFVDRRPAIPAGGEGSAPRCLFTDFVDDRHASAPGIAFRAYIGAATPAQAVPISTCQIRANNKAPPRSNSGRVWRSWQESESRTRGLSGQVIYSYHSESGDGRGFGRG